MYIATVFHGHKDLAMEAIAAGQVERYEKKGMPWLRHASKIGVRERGSEWREEVSQYGQIDANKAQALNDAIDKMTWDLPKIDDQKSIKSLSKGTVPESCHEPLDEVITATFFLANQNPLKH